MTHDDKTTAKLKAQLGKHTEKIKAITENLKKREAKKEDLKRKARTKRLIEIGGAVESILGEPIEKDDLPKLIIFLKQQEERGHYFSKAMQKETTLQD